MVTLGALTTSQCLDNHHGIISQAPLREPGFYAAYALSVLQSGFSCLLDSNPFCNVCFFEETFQKLGMGWITHHRYAVIKRVDMTC